MIIKNISLTNFRNYNNQTYDFSNNLNIITGPNGSGKTNLVEAIYYLSLSKSFRSNQDDILIENGKEHAEISATISEGEINKKIVIDITKDGKRILINNKPITKLSELASITNIVLFEPKDVLLFKGSPKARRNFLDISLSKTNQMYFEYLLRYEKALKQRNDLLKEANPDETMLEVTTEMLVKLSGPIISYRQSYVDCVNQVLSKIVKSITNEKLDARIVYKPYVEYDLDFQNNAYKLFENNRNLDLIRKSTSIGVHREDFVMMVNGHNIAEYGSQGENRIIALALKLSPYFLIKDKDKKPIVILDDVMSELDKYHQSRLIEFLKKMNQVFITGTNLEVTGASRYHIKKKNKEVF